MPNELKIRATSRDGSPDPNAPKHKRIKMGEEKSKDNLDLEIISSEDKIGIKQEAPQGDKKELKMVPIYIDENDKMHYEGSTAYTTSTRDKSNILIVRKDPKSIRSAADTNRGAKKPRVLGAHLIKHQPRLPTGEEISLVLNSWRAMLRTTGDYYPDKKRTPEEHLIDLKVLMGARTSFNKNDVDTPLVRHQWKYQEYGSLQRQYFIPSEYMAPDAFFGKFKNADDNQIVYYKRICSVREYYEMLSRDNPQYRKKGPRITRANPNPRDYRPVPTKSIAYNPYASGDKAPSDKWGIGLMSSPLGTSHLNAWKNQNNGLMGETSSAPEIRNAPLSAPATSNVPVNALVIRAPVISTLSDEQQQAAERTHRHRSDMSRSTVPIPGSPDNESSQDDEDSLFDDQLLPQEKNKIMRLRKEIKRIKGGQTYPTGCENNRARAIRNAEADRIAGNPVPDYLDWHGTS